MHLLPSGRQSPDKAHQAHPVGQIEVPLLIIGFFSLDLVALACTERQGALKDPQIELRLPAGG